MTQNSKRHQYEKQLNVSHVEINQTRNNLFDFFSDKCEEENNGGDEFKISDTCGYSMCTKTKLEALNCFLYRLSYSLDNLEEGEIILSELDKIEKSLKYFVYRNIDILLEAQIKNSCSVFVGEKYVLSAGQDPDLFEPGKKESVGMIIISFKDNKMILSTKRYSFVQITGIKEYFAEIKQNETNRQEKALTKTKAQYDKEHNHNGNGYRSKTEIKISDALESEGCLFYPNNACRIKDNNGQYINKESDFLICHKGNWGILEVDGEMWHTSAAKDHARDDLFNAHGIWFIKHYPASECWESPNKVVRHFLSRMEQFYAQ